MFIAIMWCSLLHCDVYCHNVMLTSAPWCIMPCDVHCQTAIFIAIKSCSLPHRGFVLPYCGVYCGTVVFIAMLWCSLPYCGVLCHTVMFIAALRCSLPYGGSVLWCSEHGWVQRGHHRTALRPERNGTTERQALQRLLPYCYAAVRCQPTVRFLTGVRWGLEGKSWVYKVRDLLQTCTGSKVGFWSLCIVRRAQAAQRSRR